MHTLHIVLGGASGAVGQGMLIYLLKKGHRVTALVRTREKQTELENLILEEQIKEAAFTCIVNAHHTEEEIAQLTQMLSTLDAIDIAIASLGGWYHGEELYKIPLQDWDTVVHNGLYSHFTFSKAIIPLLERQAKGMFVMINGGAAEFAVPHSGVISVVAAAQKMMSQVLHRELRGKHVQVYGVGAFALVKTKARANDTNLWLGPEEMAQYILDLSVYRGEKANHFWHPLQQPADLLIS
jgi:NADP-dependent 3-hydroxy acid dehydrogenase YdfG